jgi:translation initiation factor IF-3
LPTSAAAMNAAAAAAASKGTGTSSTMMTTPAKPSKLRRNEAITGENVLVISHEGQSLGVLTMTAALAMAKEQQMDLLEVSPDQVPPVCKIVPKPGSPAPVKSVPKTPKPDISSPSAPSATTTSSPAIITSTVAPATPLPNERSQSLIRETTPGKNNAAAKSQKEIKIGQGIESHDLQVKVNKIKEFLAKDLEVKVTVLGKPRRPPNPKEQAEFFQTILARMEGLYVMGKQPKSMGKHMIGILNSKKS